MSAIGWESLIFTGEVSTFSRLKNCCFPSKDSCRNGRLILNRLKGSFQLGQLTALMGPSGAGKSTLLRCLIEGKNYPGFDTDGRIYTYKFEDKIRACFITQDEKEHLLLNLTVKESLMCASRMKNTKKLRGGVNHEEIVRKLLSQLKLQQVENTLVENCSGGQKKRLAIGLELACEPKPNIMFLDEPTSGLDSFVGEQVIALLSDLAKEHNIAIVATIHQPSHKVFSMFNNIYILSRGGRIIFAGSPDTLGDYLRRFEVECPHNVNPADIIIEIASSVSISGDKTKQDISLTNEYHAVCSRMTQDYLQVPGILNSETTAIKNIKYLDDGLCTNLSTFGFWNLWRLTQRTAIVSFLRQTSLLMIRLALHTVVALALVTLYKTDIGTADGCFPVTLNSSLSSDFDIDAKNCSCVPVPVLPDHSSALHEGITTQNVKFHFFSLLFLMFAALMPTVLTFPTEIKIFLNEHRNGWYPTSSYYISKTVVEFVIQLVYPFLYVYFLYWYSGQIGMDHWYSGIFGFMTQRYKYFLGITLLSCFIAQGLGFLIGILCVKSFESTIIVSSSTLLFLFLFSGFFVKRIQLPILARWITHLSFIRFSFESLLIIIYGLGRCDSETEKSEVLTAFDLHPSDLGDNLIWLIAHLVVVRVLAFVALKARGDPKFVQGMLTPPKILSKPLNWVKGCFWRIYDAMFGRCRFRSVSKKSNFQRNERPRRGASLLDSDGLL